MLSKKTQNEPASSLFQTQWAWHLSRQLTPSWFICCYLLLFLPLWKNKSLNAQNDLYQFWTTVTHSHLQDLAPSVLLTASHTPPLYRGFQILPELPSFTFLSGNFSLCKLFWIFKAKHIIISPEWQFTRAQNCWFTHFPLSTQETQCTWSANSRSWLWANWCPQEFLVIVVEKGSRHAEEKGVRCQESQKTQNTVPRRPRVASPGVCLDLATLAQIALSW